MIARVKRPTSHRKTSARHAEFLAMLPAIRSSAQIAFRKLPPELRHDLIQEVVRIRLSLSLGWLNGARPTVPRQRRWRAMLLPRSASVPGWKPVTDRRRTVELRPVSQAVFRRAPRPVQ